MKKYNTLLILLAFTSLLFACKKVAPPANNKPFQSSFSGTADQDSFARTSVWAEAVPHPTIAGKYQLTINGNEYIIPHTHRTFYIYLEEFSLTPNIYTIKPTTTTGVRYNHAFYDTWWGSSGRSGQFYPHYGVSGFVNIHNVANGNMAGNLKFTTEKGEEIEGSFLLKINM